MQHKQPKIAILSWCCWIPRKKTAGFQRKDQNVKNKKFRQRIHSIGFGQTYLKLTALEEPKGAVGFHPAALVPVRLKQNITHLSTNVYIYICACVQRRTLKGQSTLTAMVVAAEKMNAKPEIPTINTSAVANLQSMCLKVGCWHGLQNKESPTWKAPLCEGVLVWLAWAIQTIYKAIKLQLCNSNVIKVQSSHTQRFKYRGVWQPWVTNQWCQRFSQTVMVL